MSTRAPWSGERLLITVLLSASCAWGMSAPAVGGASALPPGQRTSNSDQAEGSAKPGKVGSPAQTTPRNPGTAAADASPSQRRAVRGVPLDDGDESPELGELRRFEELAFPRGGTPAARDAQSGTSDEKVPGLPGRWEGSGDVPEALRGSAVPLTSPRPAPKPDSDWLRSLNLPEIPVRWEPQVLRYLDYFRNDLRGRSIMTSWLRRAGRFRSLFEAVLTREGLPKDLFYVAMVESGFEPGARSPVGAGGVWQFMPGAARAYGLEVGYWIDARRDPERSVEAAARYLKDLYVRFGSWHLAFAAYNAGYGAVLKSITRYNTNDFWELCRHEAGLPWESSLYVPKILAAAIVSRNLEAFGYGAIVPDPPYVYEKVEVPGGTSLAAVARATKSRPEVIAALNPQIIRDRIPPDRTKYQVRIPLGTSDVFAESFERGRGAHDNLETIVLRFGETLDAVAKARGITVRELRRLNGVKDSLELRAGVAIVVPAKNAKPATKTLATGTSAATTAPSGGGETEAGAGVGVGANEEEEILVAVPDRVFNYEGRERVFYRTRDGDTLDDIATAVGVRPEDLIDWNSLDGAAKLHPKMVLQIFVPKDFDAAGIVLLDPARVRVVTLGSQEFLELEAARRGKRRLVIETKAGDTLARIGRRYGLTLGDLARINRFSYNTDLLPGQRVVVYSPVGDPPREVARGLAGDSRRDRAGVSPNRRGKSGPEGTFGKSGDKNADEKSGPSRAKPARLIAQEKLDDGKSGGRFSPGRTAARHSGGADRGRERSADKAVRPAEKGPAAKTTLKKK